MNHPSDQMNTKLLAVVAVAIIVVAGVAAAIVMTNDNNDGEKKASNATGRLQVYGNANNDDYLDEADVTAIQEIVDSGKWNQKAFPLADANCDGKVDSNDVTYLKGLLKGESSKMYYIDYYGDSLYVNYPITGTIACNYVYGFMICQTLGIYDRVTAAKTDMVTLDEQRYPGCSTMYQVGSHDVLETEQVIKSGVSCIIGIQTDGMYETMRSIPGKNIDVINLSFAGQSTTGADPIDAVITAGVLLGCADAANKYAEYYDKVMDRVESSVAGISKDTMIVVFNPKNDEQVSIDTTGTNGHTFGDAWTLSQLPLRDVATGTSTNGYTSMLMEQVIKYDTDYIFIVLSTGLSTNSSTAEIQKIFDEKVEYLKGTRAYSEGHIYGVSYSSIGTYLGIAQLGLLAASMYPGSFDEQEGWDLLQECYDNFTYLNSSVKDRGELQVYSMN